MSESWDDYAAEWDQNEDVIKYADEAFNTLFEETNLDGLNILDFGCGTGVLTVKMAQYASRVVGVDNAAKMIEILAAKNKDNIEPLVLDLSNTDLKSISALNRKFDLITASSVFSFVNDYAATLSILKNLLAPNGMLIQWDWYSDGSSMGFNPEMIKKAYHTAGFSALKIRKAFEIDGEHGTMPVIMAMASPQF